MLLGRLGLGRFQGDEGEGGGEWEKKVKVEMIVTELQLPKNRSSSLRLYRNYAAIIFCTYILVTFFWTSSTRGT